MNINDLKQILEKQFILRGYGDLPVFMDDEGTEPNGVVLRN